jgi:hypothetical protein
MTSISQTDRSEYRLLENRFWHMLRQTFSRVLVTGIEPVDEYRASLSNSSPYERLLALHDDPLDVAAVLLGVTLTPEIISRYEALISAVYPEQEVYDPPLVVLEAPKRPAPDWGSELPKRRERKKPRKTQLVSMSAFERVMDRLGYTRAGQREETLLWFNDGRPSRELPKFVTTLAPSHRTSHNEPAYGVQSVLRMYDYFIDLAVSSRASLETLSMLRIQKYEFAREFDVRLDEP